MESRGKIIYITVLWISIDVWVYYNTIANIEAVFAKKYMASL